MGPLGRVPVLSKLLRRRRMDHLLDHLGELEAQMRGTVAALQELTEPGDDLAVELERLLQALDG